MGLTLYDYHIHIHYMTAVYKSYFWKVSMQTSYILFDSLLIWYRHKICQIIYFKKQKIKNIQWKLRVSTNKYFHSVNQGFLRITEWLQAILEDDLPVFNSRNLEFYFLLDHIFQLHLCVSKKNKCIGKMQFTSLHWVAWEIGHSILLIEIIRRNQ